MSARVHMSGSCDLQMLSDAGKAMNKGVYSEYRPVVRILLDCLYYEFESSRTWDVSAEEFYAIRESAKWWNLNKSDY